LLMEIIIMIYLYMFQVVYKGFLCLEDSRISVSNYLG